MNIAVRNGTYYIPTTNLLSNSAKRVDSEKISSAISKSIDSPNTPQSYSLNVLQSQYQSGAPVSGTILHKKSFFEFIKSLFPHSGNKGDEVEYTLPDSASKTKNTSSNKKGFYITIPKEHHSSLAFKVESEIERTYKYSETPKGVLINTIA